MLERRADIFVEPLNAAAKSAGRQYDRAPRGDTAGFAIDRKHRAGDAAVRSDQFTHRSVEPDRDFAVAEAKNSRAARALPISSRVPRR